MTVFSVIAVTLDALTARLPGDDDLELSVTNASLAALPVRAGGGQRAVLLFDVEPGDAVLKGEAITLIAASVADVRISGVIGLSGSAREWGEKLNGGLPEDWVPDEPLTPDGETRVRFG